jgi:hypothetical protein
MSKLKLKELKTTKTIDSFFGKKPDIIEHVKPTGLESVSKPKPIISISDSSETKELSLVEQFKKSLTPSELIAHELAEKMLGTSYDIMRTHGYLNWVKSKK